MRFTVLLLAAALVAACDPPPAPSAEPAASATGAASASESAAAPPIDPAEASSPARALAMADPGGSTPVDAEVRAAQQWVRRIPKSNDKLIELGRAWVTKARHAADPGYYLNAKACADLAIEREPSSWLAKELLAQVHLNQHQFGEAKDLCEQILAQDKEAFITLGVYSDTLLELGDMDGAYKAADRMIDFKPNLASFVRVSYLQWIRGDLPAALKTVRLAIESSNDPGQPEPKAYALVQAANYFWHKGDYEGADAGYKKALATLSDHPAALVGRGRVATALGDPRAAIEYLTLAYKQSPAVETAWRLGDARAAAGDAAGAEEAYGWVVKNGRQSDRRTLAYFYAVKNRDAEESLRLAQAEASDRPGIYTQNVLAWALYRAGKMDKAKAAITLAVRLGTKDAELLYHHGAIKIASGDKPGGEALVKQALALNPRFDPSGAAEAEKLVQTSSAPAK